VIKKLTLTLMVAALALLVAGCGDDEGTRTPFGGPAGMLSSAIPPGAVLTSATLNLYVWQVSNQTVNVHRVTDYWEEMTITWNNFGGSYAAAIDGSIPVAAVGWTSTDVTALVQDWLDGNYANYGFLLEQGTTYPRSIFLSREHNGDMDPFLEVCYMEGGVEVCEQLPAIADAEFWEGAPDDNYGGSETLRTGWQLATDLEKQSVIQFDLPVEPPDDCGPCEGKISELTLAYSGAAEATVEVFMKGKKGDLGGLVFSGQVLPGGSINFVGADKQGTLSPEIYLYVDGEYHTLIHTSCSQPIYIGMVAGDFEILDGYSRTGGRLCPLD